MPYWRRTGRGFGAIRRTSGANAEGLSNLCWAAATAGVEQALKDCDAILAVSPKALHIQDSRARTVLQMGDAAEALVAYGAVLVVDRTHVGSRYGRRLTLDALGRGDEGRAEKAAAVAQWADVVDDFEAYSLSSAL